MICTMHAKCESWCMIASASCHQKAFSQVLKYDTGRQDLFMCSLSSIILYYLINSITYLNTSDLIKHFKKLLLFNSGYNNSSGLVKVYVFEQIAQAHVFYVCAD